MDVRLLGARDHVGDVIGRPPAGRAPAEWLVYRNGDLSQRQLFLQLDYVPCFPTDAVEQPPAYLTRALAAGSVLIVPERFRRFYGDAAVYANPGDVLGLVRRLEEDPAERSKLASAAARLLEDHHDAGRFVELVTGLLPSRTRARREA